MVEVRIHGFEFGASRSRDVVGNWLHPSPDPHSKYQNAWIQEASNRAPVSIGLGLLVPLLMTTGYGEARQMISPWNVLVMRRFAQDARLPRSITDDRERERASAEVQALDTIHRVIEALSEPERERYQRIENRFMPRAIFSRESDMLISYVLALRRSAAQVFGQVAAMTSGLVYLDSDPQRPMVLEAPVLDVHPRSLQEMQLVHELTSPNALFFAGSLEPSIQCMADYAARDWSRPDVLAVVARLLRTLDFLHNRAGLAGWRLRKENVLMAPSPAGVSAPAPAVKVLGLSFLRSQQRNTAVTPLPNIAAAAVTAVFREDVEDLKEVARFLLSEEHAWLRPHVVGMITASTKRPASSAAAPDGTGGDSGVVHPPLDVDRCDRIAREREEIRMVPGRVRAWARRWAQRARLNVGRKGADGPSEEVHELE